MNRIIRAAEVLGIRKPQNFKSQLALVAAILTALSSLLLNAPMASANSLGKATVALSDPRPSVVSNYTFSGGFAGGLVSVTAIKCVEVIVSTTTGGTVAPTGFTGTGATVNAAASSLVNNSGTGWSLAQADGAGSAGGSKNVEKYTQSGAAVTPAGTTAQTFEIDGMTNSSTADTKYWYTISTYTDATCSTPVDNAAPLFINTNGSTLSATIDDTLTFTVGLVGTGQVCDGTTTTAASTPTTIPFGTVTAASNAVVCQDLTAATNATNGYTIYARYTSKPTNALAQTIADSGGTNLVPVNFSAAGVEAYGYSTNSSTLSPTGSGANRFTSSSQNWAAMTTTNAEVGYTTAPSNSTTVRVGHQVGVSTITKPGTYTTTIIYTCTPIY